MLFLSLRLLQIFLLVKKWSKSNYKTTKETFSLEEEIGSLFLHATKASNETAIDAEEK